ncbi:MULTISPECIES: Lrp/AsnC family transcriptional regulator [Microbacterium]|uniref:Lrp/AsnC family transcriptional regulator n=1 Tax=Microbacterium TaxID=33882 RepID=UPI001656A029|nr:MULTISPECIES: Lrp/AsnC family transcriptional regulator [Microbacterium]MCT1365165.1 Lrp/AsnC family transcriptional regulator [Microbacterium sp. p3-SID131]MCT1376113.1 Lrp/AsnC family transcriptional regulator [Microbacterium sp. p3-SID337]MCZ0709133.1 Lrp/AsnC family transcriptional regulator [Microbacterium paraoxydans]MDH5134572.1 Lrp/AsnC family transcriptional regulator [Microbacterium sp. RD10]MDH5138126.1 Lrp/AsnC family transcriptional regulator [Microbacterium sp. RD11]
MAPSKKDHTLDAISKTIVEMLQEDGRRSYSEIGRIVGLSEAAVRQRVQRLTESGIMQIVAVTDPMQLGFHRQAMVGVKVAGDARGVAEAIADIDEVDYVVITVGSFDVLVEAVCEDDDHLLALVNDRIRPIQGVVSTETFIYAKLQKQQFAWGTR